MLNDIKKLEPGTQQEIKLLVKSVQSAVTRTGDAYQKVVVRDMCNHEATFVNFKEAIQAKPPIVVTATIDTSEGKESMFSRILSFQIDPKEDPNLYLPKPRINYKETSKMSNPNNNVNLIGHIISEPQFLRTHQNIEFATRFLLSVKKGYKTAEGKDSRDVIPVRIRGEKRMPFAHMLKKGDHICLNGVVSSESYQSKDGTKMFSLCIEAQNVNWTYGNTKSEGKKGKIPDAPKEEEKENCCIEFDFDLSELPFS